MRKALSIIAQFILFIAAFASGMILGVFSPFHLRWFVRHPTPATTHYFDPTGLILMVALYVLILLIEAARRTVRTAGANTTAAFVAALLLGLILKFGFVAIT